MRKFLKYTFTVETVDDEDEVLESCQIKTYATELGEIVQSFRGVLLVSGFHPNNIDGYINNKLIC